jgi:calcium-dependent protein kinase
MGICQPAKKSPLQQAIENPADQEKKDAINRNKTKMQEEEKEIKINSNLIVGQNDGMPTENYQLVKRLGEGSYGVVWKVKHLLTDNDRAMKRINKNSKTKKETEQEILNEIEILKKMDHPNIVKIFEFYNTPEGYFLITEYCTKGELFDEIVDKAPFSEPLAAHIMYQIFSAVNYCHQSEIVHRDLKPENILIESVDENGLYHLKIIDFGTAKLLEKSKSENKVIGSSYYIAPEVLNKSYNEKCDLWSCGVILYILLSGRAPFSGDSDNLILEKIKLGKYDLNRSPFNKISAEAKDLIKKLLEMNPRRRISADNAINHPWFKKFDVKKLFTEVNEVVLKTTIKYLKQYNPTHKLQLVVLAYLVHNFPQIEEIKEINKIFRKFDDDCDGKLFPQDMVKALVNILKETEEKATAIVQEIFNRIDNDGNGYIQYEEFIRAGIDKKIFLDEEILHFAFDYFDKDGSGSITLQEVQTVFCVDNDPALTDELMKKIIKGIDTDGNGEISYDEFAAMMDKILS